MYLFENELKNEIKEMEAIIKKQKAIARKKGIDLKKLNIDFQKQNVDFQRQTSALNNSVRILLEAGISVQKIADSTGLSIAEIEQIKAKI